VQASILQVESISSRLSAVIPPLSEVVVVVELTCSPVAREAIRARVAGMLDDTRAFDGCRAASVLSDQDRAGSLVLVEEWSSRAAHEAYIAWREARGDNAAMSVLFTAPPVLRYLDGH
jgi:quinol monooxygenase YgiN